MRGETNQLRTGAKAILRCDRADLTLIFFFISGNAARERERERPIRRGGGGGVLFAYSGARNLARKRRLKTGGEVPGVLIAFPAQFTFNQRESPLAARFMLFACH